MNETFSAGWCVSKCPVSESIEVQFATTILRCTPIEWVPLLPPVVTACRVRSRLTPSAASEHFSELLGGPISRSLPTSCVCLELRPLPSPGITRLQRYYGPLRHPSAPGLSLTGVRLIIPDHALGLPVLRALSWCTCCRHYPGAAAGCIPRSSHPAVSAFPGRVAGS